MKCCRKATYKNAYQEVTNQDDQQQAVQSGTEYPESPSETSIIRNYKIHCFFF